MSSATTPQLLTGEIRHLHKLPSRRELPGLQVDLGPVRRFQLRARLGQPWPSQLSPLTDPTVQISRSGFFRRDSLRPPKHV